MNYMGMIISFVIGGLLVISLLTLNDRVMQNSGETVLNMSAKETIKTASQVMRLDFQRLGYNMGPTATDTIGTFIPNKTITFYADTDTLENTTAQKITWKFTDIPVSGTDAPNDYELVRIKEGASDTLQFAITQFELKGFDKNGNSTTDASKIKSIFVLLESQSKQKYANGEYSNSIWQKTFSPPNLKLQDFKF